MHFTTDVHRDAETQTSPHARWSPPVKVNYHVAPRKVPSVTQAGENDLGICWKSRVLITFSGAQWKHFKILDHEIMLRWQDHEETPVQEVRLPPWRTRGAMWFQRRPFRCSQVEQTPKAAWATAGRSLADSHSWILRASKKQKWGSGYNLRSVFGRHIMEISDFQGASKSDLTVEYCLIGHKILVWFLLYSFLASYSRVRNGMIE